MNLSKIVAMLILLMAFLFSCQPSLPDKIQEAYEQLPDNIDFNFHIRPILSDRCFACHGPDDNTREAGLRLDLEDQAFAVLRESNGHALVKGSLNKSMAWQRVISTDPEIQMPPPESNLSLSNEEIALITKWIKQGAEWKNHWAFIPPQKSKISKVDNENIQNPIDNFIQDKLTEKELSSAPEASKERLIRRLSFDLAGLPPSLEDIEQFVSDDSPKAYENLVDRLLQTDAHAERMAMEWMDVARFADSHGLHADGWREQWPWRDWAISAFKRNIPYDDFVTWQLAGDLLPEANREQKLATGFHRNNPSNSESGIISEEFRLQYVADRTNTTAKAFMGLTMECAACHDHKFDPISQKEYYQMSAFFNNVNELGMIGNDKNFGPLLPLPDPETEAKLSELSTKIESLEDSIELTAIEIASIEDYLHTIQSEKIIPPKPDGLYPFNSIKKVKKAKGRTEIRLDNNKQSTASGEPEVVDGKIGKAIRLDNDYDQVFMRGLGNFNLYESFSGGGWIHIEPKDGFKTIMGNIGDKNTGWRGWILFLDSLNRPGVKIVHSHSHNYIHVLAEESVKEEDWTHIFFTYNGSAKASGIQLFVNGKPIKQNILFDQLYKSILPVKGRGYVPDPNRAVRIGRAHNYLFTDTDDGIFKGSVDQFRIYEKYVTELEIAAFYEEESKESISATKTDSIYLNHFLHRRSPAFQKINQKLADLRKEKYDLIGQVREVMVMEEMDTPRKTHILQRGQYDALGEEVGPKTPSNILPFPENFPKNRLGLAQWIVSDKHPLTARVTVNRYWQMIFGRGLVETPHDFGSQGALPSHPELLDWLAVEFQESGWDLRALLKLMVMSATYRQSSVATEDHLNKDPQNIYLARGASYRLPVEMIRDHALAVSGLLSQEIGGASVKPYQPSGLWKEKNEFSGFLLHYRPDSGQSLYRRTLYTFIRRTSPPPAMIAFDMPGRDVCIVKRENTNTPLQALVTLNDPQFVEAARVLAEKIQKEGGENYQAQTHYGFELICGRKPNKKEAELIEKQYQFALKRYQQNPQSAAELLAVGESPFDQNLDKVETAALAMVANTILNFDEAYMKR